MRSRPMQETQRKAEQLLSRQDVPWPALQQISSELKRLDGGDHWLHHTCQGTRLVLHAPRKREKSKELQARLAKLQEQVDQASYNQMVADVTQKVHYATVCKLT